MNLLPLLLLLAVMLSSCATTQPTPESQQLPDGVQIGIARLVLERNLWHQQADELRAKLDAHQEATSCFIWQVSNEFWK